MKMTADQLRAHALRHGAEVVINGRAFNTGRHQVTRAAKPAEPRSTTPSDEPITRAEVEKLLATQSQQFEEKLSVLASRLPTPDSSTASAN